ncbi:Ig-like domain-containing protein [Pseudoalteromonas denitrificans]|uniref:Delta-60 repeat domain-containing protein n=1 Tax=Pseudoalteromonas denitrificans DSM 6059 TaxID=1123010 RepID=A0A1I1KNS4_9GAMM|nr:tandem-95 repeat protein [Pseudoalteromonas denitrificans]SFC62439.1 delta-60 repeat domain-containing protein [Pseudoalteromonas denitrificans DSM 6059]
MNNPFFKSILWVFTVLLLISCGDSSNKTSSVAIPDPDVIQPPIIKPETHKVVPFDYQQRSNNQIHSSSKVQTSTFTNASGAFRLPISNQELKGNLTASIDVEDPDGLNAIYIGFPEYPNAYILCEANCGSVFHKTLTAINPLDFGVKSGPVRLELWVDDSKDNRVLINSIDFNWHSNSIVGINAQRSSRNIDFSWEPIGSYLRYNVYIASVAGVTHKNYASLTDGQAFLALKEPKLSFTGHNDSKVFFTAVTGVDGSGESAFGDIIKVSVLNGAVDLAPVAENDFFTIDEDTILTSNLLENDTDAEDGVPKINVLPITSTNNGVLIINSDGSFSYEPAADFSGRDIFTYQVADELGQTDTALVVISVIATNDEPESSYNNFNSTNASKFQSKNNFIAQKSRVVLTVEAPGLLINDLDIDSTHLSIVTTPLVAPTQGSLILNVDGSFTYTSAEGASGFDSFTYQVTDDQGGIAQSQVQIAINGESFPPIAANDRYEIEQEQTLEVNTSNSILSNDVDFDSNDVLTISENLIRGTTHGVLNLSPDGTFSYFPNPGYYGVDSFIYEVTDLQGNKAQAGAIITVTRKNNAPTALPDSYTLDEDIVLSVDANSGVLANDSDLDLDVLIVDTNVLLAPAQGELNMSSDGSFIYTPKLNFFGTDTFQYRVVDELNLSSIETVAIEINSINDLPVANDDNAQTFTNTAVNIDVLANDTDAENETLTVISAVTDNGNILVGTNSILTYTPQVDFEGDIEIIYTVEDLSGGSSQGKVFVSINNRNSAPVALDDNFSINEDELLIIGVSGLLSNDSDENGDMLTVNTTPFVNVTQGTLTLSSDGSFLYQANENFFGTDTFEYQISDGEGGGAVAKVHLTINSINDNPIANDDVSTTAEETLINIDVLGNDSDIENSTLTVLAASAQNGTVSIENNNTINYLPTLDFVGTDIVTYQITDDEQGVDSAIVTITVLNINDSPVANPDSNNTNEDEIIIIDVLGNDTDGDNDTLIVTSARAINGSVAIQGNQSLSYTPNENFNGSDTIDYSISDSNGGTASSRVNLTISPVNDAPVAVNDISSINEDTSVIISVLNNDSDIDGDALIITSASASNGGVVILGSQSLNYTPNENFNGSDTINYSISDGNLAASANVVVTVIAVNSVPIAVADKGFTDEDISVSISVLSNDSDSDGDTLSVTSASASNGVATIQSDQSINYTPNENYNGSDTINYSISDGNGGTASSIVTVTISSVNDDPIAVNDLATTDEDSPVSISVLANDTDVDKDTLLVTSVSAINGTVVVQSDQSISYTPNENYNGSDTINYSISDGKGRTDSALVNVIINAVNDLPIAVPDSFSLNEDSTVSIFVLANDTDIDNDTLIINSAIALNGVVSFAGGTSISYTPNLNFNGSDTIDYSISDGNAGSASSSVSITISPVNDAPILSDITLTVAENTPNGTALTTLAATDADLSDSHSYSILINSGGIFAINSSTGELSIADNRSLNFESGVSHTLTIQVADSGLLTDTATVSVIVTDVAENVTPTIDTSFGSSGTASSNSFTSMRFDKPNDLAIDASGKLLVVGRNDASGNSADISIIRFNTDGTIDRSFGTQGVVNTDLGLFEEAIAIDIDASGKIVVVGTQDNSATKEIFVARYTSSGILDTSFNSTGYRVTSFGATNTAADAQVHSNGSIIVASSLGSGGFRIVKFAGDGSSHATADASFFAGADIASTLFIQSDGKVVVAGTIVNSTKDFAVARFDVSSDPAVDTSYGASGIASFDFTGAVDDIVYSGLINSSNEITLVGSTKPNPNEDMAALTIDSTGSLITAFGSSGFLVVDIDGDAGAGTNKSIARDIVEDGSGNLLFAIDKGTSNIDNVLYKTDINGVVDSTYGSSGIVNFDNNASPNIIGSMVKDSANNIILLTTTTLTSSSEPDLLIVRFSTAGALDSSFNTKGYNIFDPTFSNDALSKVIELTVAPHTGKFIAIGSSEINKRLIVARYNSNGLLDETFGSNGYFIKQDAVNSFTGKDIVELSDGRLAAVGGVAGSGFVTMLTTSGTPDNSFGSSGEYKTASLGLTFNAIKLNASKLVIGGTSNNSGTEDIYLTRMDLSGSLDNSFGSNGVATFDLIVGQNPAEEETVEDIAVLTDGSIIIVGVKHYSEGNPTGLIVKVTASGVLDTSGFVVGTGYLLLDLDPQNFSNVDMLYEVKIDSNGKIIAVGSTTQGQTSIVVIQLNSNGSVDTNFDLDGIVSHNYGSGNGAALSLVLDTTNKIFITGYNNNGTNEDVFIAKITQTGVKDTSFNGANGGILFDYNSNERAFSILISSDGSLVIGGGDNLSSYPNSFFYIQKIKLLEP